MRFIKHMVELPVYLDYKLYRLPAEVKQAMLNYWDNEFGNPIRRMSMEAVL